jgi:hypothetical protein
MLRKPKNVILRYPYCYVNSKEKALGRLTIKSILFDKKHARKLMKDMLLSLEKTVKDNGLTYVCQENKGVSYDWGKRWLLSHVDIIVVDDDNYKKYAKKEIKRMELRQ